MHFFLLRTMLKCSNTSTATSASRILIFFYIRPIRCCLRCTTKHIIFRNFVPRLKRQKWCCKYLTVLKFGWFLLPDEWKIAKLYWSAANFLNSKSRLCFTVGLSTLIVQLKNANLRFTRTDERDVNYCTVYTLKTTALLYLSIIVECWLVQLCLIK